jgi:hypothetical protein
MKTATVVALAAAGLLHAGDAVEAFGYRWTVPIRSDWAVEGSGPQQILKLLVARPSLQPRRPSQYALADAGPFEAVTLEADVRRDQGSLIIVYAWRDENHFNYAHLSVDTGVKQPVHNGIFHVYGGDRVRISQEQGPAALPATGWTPVKLTWSGKTGLVQVEVSGKPLPSLRGVDLSISSGKVGLGSFFETAQFRNVKIQGSTAGQREGTTEQ